MTFASPSETLSCSRGPSPNFTVPPFASGSGDLLVLASPIHPDRDSSLGVVNVRPSVDIHAQRPLPVSTLARESCLFAVSLWGLPPAGAGVAFGPELPPSGLVPPLSFLPTSAAFSAGHRAGLLRPAADHGVRHVSGPSVVRFAAVRKEPPLARPGMGLSYHPGLLRSPLPFPVSGEAVCFCFHHKWLARARVLPRWRHTLRSVSLTCSRATSPWSLPSRRCSRFALPSTCVSCEEHAAGFALVGSSTSGPCSARRVRCVHSTLPPKNARCFHGLLTLLQDLRLTPGSLPRGLAPPTSRRRVAHGRYRVHSALRPRPTTRWHASSPMRNGSVPGLDAFQRVSGAQGARCP
jgi:hypothetical protein